MESSRERKEKRQSLTLLIATSIKPAPADTADHTGVITPLAILAGLVLIAWITMTMARRHLRQQNHSRSSSFSLEDLRVMRLEGQLSEDEYQQALKVIQATHQPFLGHKDEE